MIFTRIFLDNCFNFQQAQLDLTLKKAVHNSTVPFEYLEECPKFRFRRVCILSGANASGKTSLGRVMSVFQSRIREADLRGILNFLHVSQYDKTRPVVAEFEFATLTPPRLHRICISTEDEHGNIRYAATPIRTNDSAQTTRRTLDLVWENQKTGRKQVYYAFSLDSSVASVTQASQMLDEMSKHIRCGWYYLLSSNQPETGHDFAEAPADSKLMYRILHTFDSSVIDVLDSRDDDGLNGYTVKFSNGHTIKLDLEGNPTSQERLSRGTFDAIQLVGFIAFMMKISSDRMANDSGSMTYYLDERMAFAHSELEQAIVNLITEKLGRHSQFFYTTHNYDILDLNYPVHSYVFLRKEGAQSQFVQPEQTFNKNDRRLLNYVKNNYFHTLPDTSCVEDLLYED